MSTKAGANTKARSETVSVEIDVLAVFKQDLVEEWTVKKQKIVYAVTQRDITVLKYFKS